MSTVQMRRTEHLERVHAPRNCHASRRAAEALADLQACAAW
jgi:hypothetical protein